MPPLILVRMNKGMDSLEQVEGLLFVAGDEGISVAEIAAATDFDKAAVLGLLEDLGQKYEQDASSSLAVMQTDDRYRLVTKANIAAVIHRYFTAPLMTALSQASLEVLAIIAYKQPVTRIAVDEIRGVHSAATIQRLVLHNLIETKGRAEEPGRPYLYVTTDYFLNYFGLKTLSDLPPLVTADALDALQAQKERSVPLMPTTTNSQFDLDQDLMDIDKGEQHG